MRKVPTNIQAKVSAAILAIREQASADIRARGITCPDTDRCPTCSRPPAAPYRRLENGRIAEGCIDASHSRGHLQGASLDWHLSPHAHALRAAELAHLKSL